MTASGSMTIQAITNGIIFDGEAQYSDRVVLVQSGRIAAIVLPDDVPDGATLFDLAGGLLAPGLIDLQVNGGGGVLFNHEPSVDTIRRIGLAHRQFGTTGFLPTLITSDYDTMRKAAAAVAEAMELGVPGLLGIHFEGPFLNGQRAGIHDAGRVRVPDDEALEILGSLDAGITLVTLAPEITGCEFIRELSGLGVVVCAGHTTASYEQIQAALRAGLCGFTHLFNAMTPMSGREPGVVGAALEDDASWFGIIADGHHSHPASFRAAVRAKRPGGAVLVSDAMATVGSTQDSFELDGQLIRLSGGRCTNADGTLAGSHLDMLSAVNNAASFAGIDWFEALRMASLYPAHALGMAAELGRILPGQRANLLALDSDRRIAATWIDGDCSLAVTP